jgi:hypothetical protein
MTKRLRWNPATGDMLILADFAAVFRLRAIFTAFWLDEIWSYEAFAQRATSVWDVFFGRGFRHDNNHHLNTAFMYFFRDAPGWAIYRRPAFAAGLLSVVAATFVGRRRGQVEDVSSSIWVAGPLIKVVSATQAGSYAAAVLSALVAFFAVKRYLGAPSRSLALIVGSCVVVSVLVHLFILQFYFDAVLWSHCRLRTRPPDRLRLHLGPLIWMALWLVTVVGGLALGGRLRASWSDTADRTLAWAC